MSFIVLLLTQIYMSRHDDVQITPVLRYAAVSKINYSAT